MSVTGTDPLLTILGRERFRYWYYLVFISIAMGQALTGKYSQMDIWGAHQGIRLRHHHCIGRSRLKKKRNIDG